MNMRPTALGIMIVTVGFLVFGSLASADTLEKAKQSVRGGGVKVSVDLMEQTRNGATFRVSMDTHSVNLDVYRFGEIVRLRDVGGRELVPTSVEGIGGGGHHRKATLQFSWPQPKPKTVILVVKDVAGVPERLFRWTVE
ncbi:MAG: hypothetical protein O7B35_08810 [Deltaproteobacteria bacterium]|nr:hypothetical protein [Deltaproteobacteria bacterium]